MMETPIVTPENREKMQLLAKQIANTKNLLNKLELDADNIGCRVRIVEQDRGKFKSVAVELTLPVAVEIIDDNRG
jgi:hypothetical protein